MIGPCTRRSCRPSGEQLSLFLLGTGSMLGLADVEVSGCVDFDTGLFLHLIKKVLIVPVDISRTLLRLDRSL